MIKKHNVTISLNEVEFKMLADLNEKLKKRSYKEPNRTDTLKFAIKFTRDNLNVLELVGDLQEELMKVKKESDLFKHAFYQFQEKVKL
ncbi:hypothetical protein ACFYKT_06355 [Cytobacillus sp. FJAT-53684]|uniref:Uncharacterized protein n=1 Tax=Cytobacillus mangrovibacter TaxID=3299024 RepID=A0ABW6JVQ9_9BACI